MIRDVLVRCGAGVLIGALSMNVAPAWAGHAGHAETSVGLIEIHDELAERSPPLANIFGEDGHYTLRKMVAIIDDAAKDDGIDALVIRLRDAKVTTTQVEELAQAMNRCRAAGKKIHLFADSYSTAELLLGSHCDEIIMQSGGEVTLPGLYMEEMYLADTFNWVGIKPDFVQVGDYKGASEPMARSGPSPQWDQNINQLLDSMYGNIRADLKAGRKLDDAKLDGAMEKAVMAGGDIAKSAGLIDAVVDLPALTDHLKTVYGGDIAWENLTESEGAVSVDMQNPFTLLSKLMRPPSHKPKRDTIAVLHVDGPIVDGDSSSGGLFGGDSVGSYTIRRSLQELEDEGKVKGVVLRINSPGGSAIASESMWLGLKRLSEKKPVWVSVGSMAASGGYYIAVSGGKIFVNPSSIVGSIGVVGGKLAMGGLYEKVKLHVVPRSRGPMGGLLGSTNPWTDTERSLIRTRMTETYDQFTRRVTSGRPGIDLSTTAEGRLFTGNLAIGKKMADEIGGLTEAIAAMAANVKLEKGSYDVLDYPPAPGLAEMLEQVMGTMASAPRVQAPASGDGLTSAAVMLREIVGPQAWDTVRAHLSAMLEMRKEHVLLVSPRVLIFK
jgi:protease-4